MKRLASRPWLLPVLAAVVFHLPALFCDFVYDDVPLIAEHPHLSDPSFIARIWTRDYGLEFTREPKGLYRPAFMALVFLVRQLAGASPLTFHLTSLALFCVAAALVTRLAAAVDLRRSRAFPIVAGTLYAVHPARVETVSLVMSLPDLLVEICALGLACALLRTTLRTTPAVGWRAPAVCGALSLLAALSKESAFFIIPALSVTALLLGCLRRAPKSCDCGRSAFPDAARPDDRPGLFPPSTIVASAAVSKQRAISAIASLSALSAGFMLRSLVGVHAPFPFAAGIQRLFGESSGASLRTLGFALKDVLMPGPTVFWRQTALTGNSAFAPVIALVIAAFAAWWALAFLRRSLPMALLAAWIGAGGVNLMLLAAAGYPYSERYLAIAPAAIALCAAGRAVFGFVAGRRLVSAAAGGTRRMAGWLVAAYLAGCGGYTLAGSAVKSVFSCKIGSDVAS